MLVGFAASSRTLRHALLFIYKLVVAHLRKTYEQDFDITIFNNHFVSDFGKFD
jgi:hypothetical protein